MPVNIPAGQAPGEFGDSVEEIVAALTPEELQLVLDSADNPTATQPGTKAYSVAQWLLNATPEEQRKFIELGGSQLSGKLGDLDNQQGEIDALRNTPGGSMVRAGPYSLASSGMQTLGALGSRAVGGYQDYQNKEERKRLYEQDSNARVDSMMSMIQGGGADSSLINALRR